MTEIVSPAAVERRLIALSKELDEATEALMDQERVYFVCKAALEVKLAERRYRTAQRMADKGVKATVQEKEDMALLECREEIMAAATAEGNVRAFRANVARVKTQIDVARSVGTSVRAAMELV